MDDYVNFTQRVLNLFGVVQLSGPEKKTNRLLTSLVITLSITSLVQTLIQLLFNEGTLYEKTLGLAMLISRTQSVGKLIALASNRKTFNKLDEMFRNSDAECKKANDIFMRKMFKINIGIITFYVFNAMLYLLKPMIIMTLAYLKTGEIVQSTPYPFWYPFEKVSYTYYLTYLYEVYVGLIIMVYPFATDQLFLILVALCSIESV